MPRCGASTKTFLVQHRTILSGAITMTKCSANSRFPLFDEIDKGLNKFVKDVLNQDTDKSGGAPPLSVYELNDSYVVECDLPGVKLDDIGVEIHDGVLEISGKRNNTFADGAKVTVNERAFTDFSRKLQLSKDINADGVAAELGNGVLKVTVPKSESVLARKISVRKAGDDS